MAIEDEFGAVDLLLDSATESRGVDAFALSLIKVERQVRRLITFFVFQSEAFVQADVPQLQKVMAERRLYLRHLIAAWSDLCKVSLPDLVGDKHDHLLARIVEATEHRNKVFHGQLTGISLSRSELAAFATDLKAWCTELGSRANAEFGYDGMDRSDIWGSFRKSTHPGIDEKIARQFDSVTEYETYLKGLENRPNISLQPTARGPSAARGS